MKKLRTLIIFCSMVTLILMYNNCSSSSEFQQTNASLEATTTTDANAAGENGDSMQGEQTAQGVVEDAIGIISIGDQDCRVEEVVSGATSEKEEGAILSIQDLLKDFNEDELLRAIDQGMDPIPYDFSKLKVGECDKQSYQDVQATSFEIVVFKHCKYERTIKSALYRKKAQIYGVTLDQSKKYELVCKDK